MPSTGASVHVPVFSKLFVEFMAVCISLLTFFPKYDFAVPKSNYYSQMPSQYFHCNIQELSTCDWKLYVHFGTWKNADALGMYYILSELDVYVLILFSYGEI